MTNATAPEGLFAEFLESSFVLLQNPRCNNVDFLVVRQAGGVLRVSVQFAYDFVNRIIQRLHTPSLNVRRSLRQMRVHAALCFQFLRSLFFRIHVLLTP